jgi:hypothetical protein
MKYLISIIYILFTLTTVYAQDSWKDASKIPDKYKVDGSLSIREVTDTTQLKTIVNQQRFVIKKSSDFTYIAIRSNTNSMLNAYLIDPNKISVLHASAALGQMDFLKKNDEYIPTKTEFDWIYRDPEVWDEKHPEGVDSLKDFYSLFGWTANTWNYGSYREVEMIINNAHFINETRLIISYTSIEDGEYAIRFFEGKNNVSISGDKETDMRLHNGHIPDKLIVIYESK